MGIGRGYKVWLGVLTFLVILLLLADAAAVYGMLKLGGKVNQAVNNATQRLQRLENENFTFTVPIHRNVTVPIKTSVKIRVSKVFRVKIRDNVSVPVNEVVRINVPVNQRVKVRVNTVTPVFINTTSRTTATIDGRKVNLTVPIHTWTNVTINTTVEVPINTTVPVSVPINVTPTVPINTTVRVPFNDTITVPVSTTVRIPINMNVTITVNAKKLGIKPLIDQLIGMLRSVEIRG